MTNIFRFIKLASLSILSIGLLYNCGSEGDKGHTQYPEFPEFRFIDQDSNWVTRKNLENSIYVADFFFTRCKTICPVMQSNMARLYFDFEDENSVKFLSHTIDPEFDNTETLKKYAERIGVSSSKWSLVTGEKEDIYGLAHNIYKTSVLEDASLPDGYIHSGAFILIYDGKIMSHYDGTNSDDINKLKQDINGLLLKQ